MAPKTSKPPVTQLSNQEGGTSHARHHLHDSIQEHISLADAWNAFRLFAEPDSADLYSEIELAEHNWEEDTERSLARLTLGERYSF